MFSYNRVQLVGYQTQPVDVRQTPQGTSVTDLNLVVPYSFTNDSGQEMTGKSFHTVTVWGGMADVAGQYLQSGGQVFISARLQTDSWDDEQSGEKRSKTKLVALDMILLDPKDGQGPALSGSAKIGQSVNRADIIGNVTRDPEVRTTTSGQQVVSLGVATNDRWKDKGGEMQERTEYHNVVIWGDLGQEAAQHLKKGSKVYISGRVQTRSWETQSGSKRTTTEIIADQCSMLGRAHDGITDNIDGAGQAARSSAPAQDMNQDTGGSSMDQDPVGVATPAVKYESEVKVEDLPF